MSGYSCILCEGENGPVVQITTSLQTGATVAVCAADIPVALVGGLAAELGVDGDRLYDAISRWVDREAKKLAKANEALPAAWDDADNVKDPNTEYGQEDADALNQQLAEAGQAGGES